MGKRIHLGLKNPAKKKDYFLLDSFQCLLLQTLVRTTHCLEISGQRYYQPQSIQSVVDSLSPRAAETRANSRSYKTYLPIFLKIYDMGPMGDGKWGRFGDCSGKKNPA